MLNKSESEPLSETAKRALVDMTWEAIVCQVRDRVAPSTEFIKKICRQHSSLEHPSGVFITVYVQRQLRGCLGELQPKGSLAAVVACCAQRTVHIDPRFEPIQVDELRHLTFKLSVLSLAEPVEMLDEIRIGVHGLIVQYKLHHGVLLPEVPIEQQWDLAFYLKALWRKAGIDPQIGWEQTQLSKFATQLIQSADFPLSQP